MTVDGRCLGVKPLLFGAACKTGLLKIGDLYISRLLDGRHGFDKCFSVVVLCFTVYGSFFLFWEISWLGTGILEYKMLSGGLFRLAWKLSLLGCSSLSTGKIGLTIAGSLSSTGAWSKENDFSCRGDADFFLIGEQASQGVITPKLVLVLSLSWFLIILLRFIYLVRTLPWNSQGWLLSLIRMADLSSVLMEASDTSTWPLAR